MWLAFDMVSVVVLLLAREDRLLIIFGDCCTWRFSFTMTTSSQAYEGLRCLWAIWNVRIKVCRDISTSVCTHKRLHKAALVLLEAVREHLEQRRDEAAGEQPDEATARSRRHVTTTNTG